MRRARGRPRSAAGPHSPPRGLAASARRPGAGPCPSGAAAETSLRCHSCWGGTRRPCPAQLPPRRASPLPRGGGDSRRSYRGRGAGPGAGEAAGEPGPAAGGSAPAWPRFALPRAKHRAWGELSDLVGHPASVGGVKPALLLLCGEALPYKNNFIYLFIYFPPPPKKTASTGDVVSSARIFFFCCR